MKIIAFKLPLWLLARSMFRWYRKRWINGAAGPISAGCYVTNRCNLRCRMCNYWRCGTPQDIPLELYKRVVEDLAGMGNYYFSVTGGEPFLLDDIIERLSYAAKRLPYVHAVTNGWLMDASLARAINRTGIREISVSVDGFQRFHDYLRGRQGSFDRAMNAIDLLKTYAPKVFIVTNTVIAAENLADILPLMDVFERMGVYSKLQPINRHPNIEGSQSSSQYGEFAKPDMEQLRRILCSLVAMKRVANSNYYLSKIPDFFAGRPLLEPRFKCLVPYFHLELLWDSKAYPCLTGMTWKDGFSYEEGLEKLVKSDTYIALQKRLEMCKKCDYNLQICYWEPRVLFPLGSWFRYSLLGRGKGNLNTS